MAARGTPVESGEKASTVGAQTVEAFSPCSFPCGKWQPLPCVLGKGGKRRGLPRSLGGQTNRSRPEWQREK